MAFTATWPVEQVLPSTSPTTPPENTSGVIGTGIAASEPTQTLEDELKTRVTGSVFINGQPSYSGADIKVVVHVYDGGKSARARRELLEQQVKDNNKRISDARAEISTLEARVNDPDGVFSSVEINKLSALNREVILLQNTAIVTGDEIDRLAGLDPRFSTKVLAELQTISISTHREKFPVRALGAVYPKAYTRANRTTAGSMIFTVFDKNVLEEFLDAHPSDFDAHNPVTSALLDQIPPFDITIAFANELGQVSRMVIYGVEFINEGQTMSIEDLLLENVVQYIARDVDPMRIVGRRKIDEGMRLSQEIKPVPASSLLQEDEYKKYKDSLSPFERYKNRNNPFV